MQIERAIVGEELLGPGLRLCVWVNGCYRNCKGCVSKNLQMPAPENEQDVEEFLSMFSLSIIDGVTISGGEPFEQIGELKKAVAFLCSQGIEDILIYTGYTLEELLAKKDENINFILGNIAVLIDGPYIERLDSGLGNLKGSDNQKIYFFKEKVKTLYETFYKKEREMKEFYLPNQLLGVGIPTKEYIENFHKK